MCEQEKKRQKFYDLINTETKPKFPCLTYTNQIIMFFLKSKFLRKIGVEMELKTKRKHFNCSPVGD